MTNHQLARLLLQQPEAEVFIKTEDNDGDPAFQAVARVAMTKGNHLPEETRSIFSLKNSSEISRIILEPS